MKIAIIGNSGSGKSTLALKLHKLLDIPLYHLDQYFWQPGWVEPERAEFEKIHNELCDKPEWIIEGQAIRFFEYRIKNADIVIFIDRPTYLCFYRVFKRALTHFGHVHFAAAKDCPERGPSLKFLKYVWQFTRERKPVIEELFKKYRDKKIFVIKNDQEIEDLIQKFKTNTV